jgi:serine O-acetyltransferase
VTIYQGVTLGGTGKEKGKRHPTLEDHVLVATGAKVLGNITIGKNSKVGAGSVVLQNVPPNATVVGIPGKVVIKDGIKVGCELDHRDLPDPVADKFREMQLEMKKLCEELERMKRGSESK